MFYTIVFMFSIYALAQLVMAKANFRVTASKAECIHRAPEIIKSFECHLEQHNKRDYGYGHIEFQRPIEELVVRFSLSFNNSRIPFIYLLNTRVKLCDVLSNRFTQMIFREIRKSIEMYTNEIPKCPLKANFNYTITKAQLIHEDDWPVLTPFGNYQFLATFYYNETFAGHFKLNGRFIKTKN